MSDEKNVPKLRFPGFTDDWEQRKLGDIADYKKGPFGSAITKDMFVPKSDDSVKVYEQQNAINKDWSLERYFLPKTYATSKLKSFEVHGGDIIVSCAGTIGEIYEIPDDAEPGVINQALMRVRVNEDIVDKKLFIISFSNMIDEFTRTHSNGSAIKNIPPFADLKPMEVLMPSLQEQCKISEYFSNLDKLITLHQRKLEHTKDLKKSMLQKMFPKKGEKIPEVRFPEFTDAWEQRKLSDAIEKLTGGASIAPDDYIEDGYRTIPKGAVNETGVANLSGCKYVSNVFFEKNVSSKTSSGELVTSLRDLVPTAPNMGRIVRIIGNSEDFLMPQGVYSIKVKEKIDEDYLIAYSNSPIYRKIISAEKNGSTQVHIRNGEFLNIDFPMPCYEEQRLIGKTISNLDHLITLHQRKLEHLQLLKKGLLQQMFV